jgi:hypothetical protein
VSNEVKSAREAVLESCHTLWRHGENGTEPVAAELVVAIRSLIDRCHEMEDEIDAIKQAVRLVGGIDVDELLGLILSGAKSERLEAIGERSGFKHPGGFRRLVLDRLDEIEKRLGITPPDEVKP